MSATTMFRRMFASKARTYRHPKPARGHQLAIDTLERRDCPATTVTQSLVGGVLTVEGTEGADDIAVRQSGSTISVFKKVSGTASQVGASYSASRIASISIRGLGGDDRLGNETAKDSRMTGDGGRDTITGGTANDQIFGGTNDDTLYGRDGNDDLSGEQGADRLYGASGIDGAEVGPSNDTLQGGDGADAMYGGYGSDLLIGGNDNDWLQGQWGDDVIVGSTWDFANKLPLDAESVTVAGYTTNDTLFGEYGNDKLYGGVGNDNMSGGAEADDMTGGPGNDNMWGAYWDTTTERAGANNDGSNADTLRGGIGDDMLNGGDGNDWLWGEAGTDLLFGMNGSDAENGGSGDDTLYGDGRDGPVAQPGNDNLVGGEGQDWLYGGSGSDTLWGAGWQDVYDYTDSGNYLYGQDGNDNLYGGNGFDWLDGGYGNDGLFGGADGVTDYLTGGPDADRFLMPANLYVPDIAYFGYGLEDSAQDLADEDAQPTFLNGYNDYLVASPTETDYYTPKNWSDADVLRSDAVLALLHAEARSTRLLERSDGGDLVLVRHGGSSRGFNDGWVHMTDANNQFGGTDEQLRGYMLHEIGHGWQGAAFSNGPYDFLRWSQFVALSGWTDTNPNSANYTMSTNEGRLKADGSPDVRWYLNAATFATDGGDGYARTNENEDFAELFAAYFTMRAGWNFYDGVGAAAIPEKMQLFSDWMAGM